MPWYSGSYQLAIGVAIGFFLSEVLRLDMLGRGKRSAPEVEESISAVVRDNDHEVSSDVGGDSEKVVFSPSRRVEYVKGNMPLILVCGHNGKEKPSTIPDRTYGSSLADLHTLNVTREVSNLMAFRLRNKHRPYVIISHLHRSKLDVNRDIEEAAQGNSEAEESWHQFHQFVEAAEKEVRQQFGHGLVIDVHGHKHEEGYVELGYRLKKKFVNAPDEELNQNKEAFSAASIHGLISRHPANSLSDFIRGERSFGGLLNKYSVDVMPSPNTPSPGTMKCFRGGYTIKRHGSGKELPLGERVVQVDALQIEIPSRLRREHEDRMGFVSVFTQAILEYLELNYDWGDTSKLQRPRTAPVKDEL